MCTSGALYKAREMSFNRCNVNNMHNMHTSWVLDEWAAGNSSICSPCRTDYSDAGMSSVAQAVWRGLIVLAITCLPKSNEK